jgi:type I restriction enzyme S subunit
MSALEYPKVRLGDVVERVTKGTTPTTHGHAYTTEGISFIRVENLRNGVIDKSTISTFISKEAGEFLKRSSLEADDVLISIAGTIGRTAIVREHDLPANTNQAVAIIRGASKYFEPVFLRYALESPALYKEVTGEARGGAMQNISLENVRNLSVPLPPIDEQRRIVAEIEKQFTRLDVGMEVLKRAQANFKRYRAAVLKAACEGHLVPTEAELARSEGRDYESAEVLLERILTERRTKWNGRGKYSEPAPPNIADLPSLPSGWIWASLAQLGTHIVDGTHKTPTYVREGVPFLSAKDVSGFSVSFDACRYIPEVEHRELIKRCLPRRGNVLITKSGTIGRVAVVECDEEFSLFESVANVPIIEPLNSHFVSYSAYVGIAGSFGTMNQKGVAVRHLHLEDLRRLPIPLPPLAEQERIVAEVERRLSVVDELEATVTANLQRATRLRQAVLQKAFSGGIMNKDQYHQEQNHAG